MSITESPSRYSGLENMSIRELLVNMNNEDKTVPLAVEKVIPAIERLTTEIAAKMSAGGRLFYIGAGTSGRIGILDASEIPPTYGMPQGRVIGLIAGGDTAGPTQLLAGYGFQANGVTTGCIVCNTGSEVAKHAQFPIEVVVGPEFVTGSTRMKSGTAQKLILNMISTATMIKLGRVKGNKMVDMQLSNVKLVNRGTRMVMEELGIPQDEAERLLKQFGSVRKAVESRKGHARN